MADSQLQQFFSGVLLTELVRSEAVKSGVPDPLPPEMKTVRSGQNPVGTQVQWLEVVGNRQTAKYVHQNSPAAAANTPGVTRRFATAIGSKEELIVDTEMIQALMSNIPLYAQRAKQEIVNRVRQFRARYDNLEVSSRASILANGAIYFDNNEVPNLLPSSTGAGPVSVKFGVPADNQFTKNSGLSFAGLTGIGDFSSASLDLAGNLRKLKTGYRRKTGYKPDVAYYGQSVPGYIQANTTLKAYMQFNPGFNQFLKDNNEIPDGFLGFKKWIPVSEMFFDDQNAATQTWFPDNYLGFTPAYDLSWWDYFDCGSMVPRNVVSAGWVPDFNNLSALIDVIYGLFSYGEFSASGGVVALKQYVGGYFLPTLKVPGVLTFGTCS